MWSAFADSNNTCSLKEVVYQGEPYRVRNQLFPFSRREADGWSGEDFAFAEEGESFFRLWAEKREFSDAAQKLMQAARKFYAYCYRTGKAEIWDAGYAQLKAAVTEDEGGRVLLSALKKAHRALGKKLLPEIYSLGFVPEDVNYFEEGE